MTFDELAKGLPTLSAFAAFIGVCLWAYSKHSKKNFDDAAQLPFADEQPNDTNPRKD